MDEKQFPSSQFAPSWPCIREHRLRSDKEIAVRQRPLKRQRVIIPIRRSDLVSYRIPPPGQSPQQVQ
ncbi:hypothetical protein OAF58_01060 [bacterium]|nr:hypothetical protein [bacterium]